MSVKSAKNMSMGGIIGLKRLADDCEFKNAPLPLFCTYPPVIYTWCTLSRHQIELN